MSEIELDPDRQVRAREYARLRRRLMLVDLGLGAVYCLAWLVFGWSMQLGDWLAGWTANPFLQVAGFGFVFGGLYVLINLPMSYYSGYVLPHRYELSTQTLSAWVIDQFKGGVIGAFFGLLVLEIIYAVLRAAPQTWWLWAALILVVFNILLANLAPVLLFPIFYKFKPLEDEYADLAARLMRLADRSGTRVRGVYQFDMSRRTKAANAALTGLGNTRRIILGDTLLKEFTPDEIETVLAHELGHHVHHDIPLGILVESVITLAGLYVASLVLNWGVTAFGFDSQADIAALPLFVLAIGLFGLITMPLENLFSRWRERRADEYALQMTHNGVAYAAALTRLANQNLAEVDPEPWVEFLLYSHPALGRRIVMAQEQTHPA